LRLGQRSRAIGSAVLKTRSDGDHNLRIDPWAAGFGQALKDIRLIGTSCHSLKDLPPDHLEIGAVVIDRIVEDPFSCANRAPRDEGGRETGLFSPFIQAVPDEDQFIAGIEIFFGCVRGAEGVIIIRTII
jgi:hypothetical protein